MQNDNKVFAMNGVKLTSLSVLLGGCFLVSNTAIAQVCSSENNVCTPQLGWYVGSELGSSYSDYGNDDLDRLIANSGFNVNSAELDDNDSLSGLFLGYQFSPSWAAELGYRDLGEYSTSLTGTTTDPLAFTNFASGIAPESGDGLSLGMVVSKPIDDLWKVGARFGLWRWDGDIDSSSSSVAGRSINDSGTDVYFGLEATYQFTQNFQAYVAATRYSFSRDNSDTLSLGVRYFFGKSTNQTSEAVRKPPEPVEPSTPKAKPALQGKQKVKKASSQAPTDSDKDGVFDSRDRCANTPSNHVVDSLGCTEYEAVQYQHQLIIYYANDSDVVESKFFRKIEELVKFSRKNDIKYMQIVGHTSEPGTPEYNDALSVRRAESLANILVKKYGFARSQLEIIGKGESELAVSGSTESAHAKNRRIEVNLSATGKIPKTK